MWTPVLNIGLNMRKTMITFTYKLAALSLPNSIVAAKLCYWRQHKINLNTIYCKTVSSSIVCQDNVLKKPLKNQNHYWIREILKTVWLMCTFERWNGGCLFDQTRREDAGGMNSIANVLRLLKSLPWGQE